ncbi:MAG: Hsp20 family protein [Thiohalocapsa sp.]
MSTMFDFAPLWRTGIGFDHLFDLLGRTAEAAEAGTYPPYDIEKTGDDAYRLTLALAGWQPEEVSIVTQPNLLVVSGNKAKGDGKAFLYHGIPGGAFERRFNLAEHVSVTGARMQNGLLTIELVRQVPEAMKPRHIAIASNSNQKAIENKQAA